jgi:hypothetical protein
LHTIYVGSAPESGKKTFLWKMRKELSAVIKEFPKATVVGVADGARDNWEFLNEVTDRQIIDFFHVAEYLNEAADIICSNDVEKEEWLSSRCHDLKHKSKTAEAIIIEQKLRTTDRGPVDARRRLGCHSFLQEPGSPAGRRYCPQVHDLFSVTLGHRSATVGAHFSRLSEI